MIIIKEYYMDPETNEIAFYRVKEILRGDPIFMRIIADKRGVRGGRFRVCPVHRDEVKAYSKKKKHVKPAVTLWKMCIM